jgi:hypothetical protein
MALLSRLPYSRTIVLFAALCPALVMLKPVPKRIDIRTVLACLVPEIAQILPGI